MSCTDLLQTLVATELGAAETDDTDTEISSVVSAGRE